MGIDFINVLNIIYYSKRGLRSTLLIIEFSKENLKLVIRFIEKQNLIWSSLHIYDIDYDIDRTIFNLEL